MIRIAQKTPAVGTISISVAVVLDSFGRMLAVRKRGTRHFIQPGGKIEQGETAVAALARELHEEIGWTVHEEHLAEFGQIVSDASNEPGTLIKATLFTVEAGQVVQASAEIEQAEWLARSESDREDLSTLTRLLLMAYAPSVSAIARVLAQDGRGERWVTDRPISSAMKDYRPSVTAE